MSSPNKIAPVNSGEAAKNFEQETSPKTQKAMGEAVMNAVGATIDDISEKTKPAGSEVARDEISRIAEELEKSTVENSAETAEESIDNGAETKAESVMQEQISMLLQQNAEMMRQMQQMANQIAELSAARVETEAKEEAPAREDWEDVRPGETDDDYRKRITDKLTEDKANGIYGDNVDIEAMVDAQMQMLQKERQERFENSEFGKRNQEIVDARTEAERKENERYDTAKEKAASSLESMLKEAEEHYEHEKLINSQRSEGNPDKVSEEDLKKQYEDKVNQIKSKMDAFLAKQEKRHNSVIEGIEAGKSVEDAEMEANWLDFLDSEKVATAEDEAKYAKWQAEQEELEAKQKAAAEKAAAEATPEEIDGHVEEDGAENEPIEFSPEDDEGEPSAESGERVEDEPDSPVENIVSGVRSDLWSNLENDYRERITANGGMARLARFSRRLRRLLRRRNQQNNNDENN